MSGLSGMLGTAGGAAGTGFSGPTGVDQGQIDTAYNQTQSGIKQQQDFVNALQNQNGLGNQSSVFNQLQSVANGTGPNPAQAQLAQATGANTANQAALMAGQRGASQNVGLMARQAAQQGAANQQNSAGQAATLQAQQSLGAMNQLGGIAGQQVGQQQTGLQNLNQNSLAQQSNLLGLQANINSANAGLAGQGMANQANLIGGAMNGAGSVMSMLADGGEVPDGISQYQQPNMKVDTSAGKSGGSSGGGGAGGAGALLALLADGTPNAPLQAPTVPMAQMPTIAPVAGSVPQQSGPKSKAAQTLKGGQPIPNNYTGTFAAGNAIGQGLAQGAKSMFSSSKPKVSDASESALQNQLLQHNAYSGKEQQSPASNDMDKGGPMAAKGGKVPALVSPGEQYLPPEDVSKVVNQGKNPMSVGKKVPGKPKVGGAKNDYANDTVKANLDEGGIVIPRSVTQGPNPHWAAMRFVHATMKKNRHK